jgi:transposase InsO family protein
MPKDIVEERLKWIMPLIRKEIKLLDLIKVCPHSGRSLKRWRAAFKVGGREALMSKSTEPKTQPNETPIRIKERIIEIRKDTKKCALKIHWQLEKEGILINERTVGKILKKEGLVRKYRVRKITYKYIKAVRKPGELLEIDVKVVPGKVAGKQYFQYTAIDTASRWRYLMVFCEQTTANSILFLMEVMRLFPHRILAIKTDNGSIFTNYYLGTTKRSDMTVKTLHALDVFCAQNNIIHYLIDPGKPAQNGTVERSHREDQEKFYDVNDFKNIIVLRDKPEKWNTYYNNLEHCGLDGKTPKEFLANYSKIIRQMCVPRKKYIII